MEEDVAAVKVYLKSRSLTITIPKEAAKRVGIRSKMLLSVKVAGNKIVLSKVKAGLNEETFNTFVKIYEEVLTLIEKEKEIDNLLLKGKIESWKYAELKREIIQTRKVLQEQFENIRNELNKVINDIKSKIPALCFIGKMQSIDDFILLASFIEEKEFEENIESIYADISDLKEEEVTLINMLQNLEKLHSARQISEGDYKNIKVKYETRLFEIKQALDKLKSIMS